MTLKLSGSLQSFQLLLLKTDCAADARSICDFVIGLRFQYDHSPLLLQNA